MQCPECGEKTIVFNSRRMNLDGKFCVYRRRRCQTKDCMYKFTTYELEEIDLSLIRRSYDENRRVQHNN